MRDGRIKIVQDVEQAILVMRDAGRWLKESEKNPSKWWQLKNLKKKFLFQYAKPKEFYVVLVGGKPAAAAILQFSQKVLYIDWLCVARRFAGQGLPKIIIDFAKKNASEKNIKSIQVDTNADETKLRKIYEDLGFKLVEIIQEDYRETAFYQI